MSYRTLPGREEVNMIKIMYEVKKLDLNQFRMESRYAASAMIDECQPDTAFFVCEAIKDLLQDIESVMDPEEYDQLKGMIKRGELL